MTATVYGIRNCDTVKKARAWLETNGVDYAFHDYKTAGVDPAMLSRWVGEFGWQALLNRSGTTFRKLDDSAKQDLDEQSSIALMLAHPSLIRRPVVEVDGRRAVGFKPETYSVLFRRSL